MTNEQPDNDLSGFEASLSSFTGWSGFEHIPGVVFRCACRIIKEQRIDMTHACQRIAQTILTDEAERHISLQYTIAELRERESKSGSGNISLNSRL